MPNDPFQQFLAAYPVTRRKGGSHARACFYDALAKVPFALLLHAVEQHKRSVQWQNPRFIPSMTTWLNDEMWIQTLPEPAAPTLSPADQQRRWASLAPGDQLRRLK